jgi:hypothetical protein
MNPLPGKPYRPRAPRDLGFLFLVAGAGFAAGFSLCTLFVLWGLR